MNSSSVEVSGGDGSLLRFVDRLTLVIPRLCRAMIRSEENYLSRGDLTLPQLWVLDLLLKEAGCRMNDLAAKLCLKPSTATMLVNRLARMGLIRRNRNAADRRAVAVVLTPKGHRAIQEIHAHRHASLMALFGKLSGRDRSTYLNILEKLAGQLTPGHPIQGR